MSIKYSQVVPWGRSYREYLDMFSLNGDDLSKKILGCGDGPACFNAELTRKGGSIVSIDPIYKMSKDEIQLRINETYDIVLDQTLNNRDKFVWNKIETVEQLAKIRLEAMNLFLEDFESGLQEKRYIFAEMPSLPFADDEFELALSSHFLFLYSDNLSFEFHLNSIMEMLRVAKEIRIFPILDINSEVSPHLEGIKQELKKENFFSEIINVNYEFQKNANQMLKLTKR